MLTTPKLDQLFGKFAGQFLFLLYKINARIYMTTYIFINRILLAKTWRYYNDIILNKKLFITRPCLLLRDIPVLRVFAFHTLECECAIHPPSHATKRASRVGQLCVTDNWLIVVFLHNKHSNGYFVHLIKLSSTALSTLIGESICRYLSRHYHMVFPFM